MKTKVIFILFVILMTTVSAAAQDPIGLGPTFKPGQQARYVITAEVDQVVTPTGGGGISNGLHREFTATILVRTTGIDDKGLVTQEATVEEASFSNLIDGKLDRLSNGPAPGERIELKFFAPGNLQKATFSQEASGLGLADLIISLLRWFPATDISASRTWTSYQPALYSTGMRQIATGSAANYKLVSIEGGTAIIEGAITLNQSGGSRIFTTDGPLDVNAIGAGKGSTRFEYDVAGNRFLSGVSETRFEGKLANIVPSADGEKSRAREGSFVETAKFTIKLVQ